MTLRFITIAFSMCVVLLMYIVFDSLVTYISFHCQHVCHVLGSSRASIHTAVDTSKQLCLFSHVCCLRLLWFCTKTASKTKQVCENRHSCLQIPTSVHSCITWSHYMTNMLTTVWNVSNISNTTVDKWWLEG